MGGRRILAITGSSSENGLLAVLIPTRLAVIALVADVLNGLEARPLTYCESLDVLANFDNHSGAFVARALDSQLGHLGHVPVMKHVVNIAQAESRCVELYQNIVGSLKQEKSSVFCW